MINYLEAFTELERWREKKKREEVNESEREREWGVLWMWQNVTFQVKENDYKQSNKHITNYSSYSSWNIYTIWLHHLLYISISMTFTVHHVYGVPRSSHSLWQWISLISCPPAKEGGTNQWRQLLLYVLSMNTCSVLVCQSYHIFQSRGLQGPGNLYWTQDAPVTIQDGPLHLNWNTHRHKPKQLTATL